MTANYTTATVLHFQMEPLNALAVEVGDVMEIHTGNQWQSLILPTLAVAFGRDIAKIVMRTYPIGGGFGRRLNGDYAIPAALAAKALGKPVKMILTRDDDARFDSVRSPCVQTLRMAFDAKGAVTAMEHHAVAGWPTQVMAAFFMPKGTNGAPCDPFAIAGADHWYEVGALKVRALFNDLANDLANAAFRPGWLRSVGPDWTNWALGSFMDQADAHVKAAPLAFRLGLLTGAGRNAGVTASDKGKALNPRTGFIAAQKLTLVTDAGTLIAPNSAHAHAQTEGAALWGRSMALFEGTEFVAGQVRDTNLDTCTPLQISDMPVLDLSFGASTELPVGLGEPATTAIAIAIFAATGARVTHSPVTPQAVLATIAKAL